MRSPQNWLLRIHTTGHTSDAAMPDPLNRTKEFWDRSASKMHNGLVISTCRASRVQIPVGACCNLDSDEPPDRRLTINSSVCEILKI